MTENSLTTVPTGELQAEIARRASTSNPVNTPPMKKPETKHAKDWAASEIRAFERSHGIEQRAGLNR